MQERLTETQEGCRSVNPSLTLLQEEGQACEAWTPEVRVAWGGVSLVTLSLSGSGTRPGGSWED
jgi:hypothetical protein